MGVIRKASGWIWENLVIPEDERRSIVADKKKTPFKINSHEDFDYKFKNGIIKPNDFIEWDGNTFKVDSTGRWRETPGIVFKKGKTQ